jgi:hypothetical protein
MNNRVTEILNKTNLNWSVRKEQLYTGGGIIIPNAMGIVREDTNVAFSKPMTDSYYPFQNSELIELLDKVSGMTGLEIHKGGSFKDGARVYIQLKSGDLRLGDDKVEGYLTGINSFDGSTSLAFGPSNITISCMNTFFAAFRDMETKIRHTKNMTIKIDDVCKALDGVLHEEKIMFDNIKKLSEVRLDDRIKEGVIRSLFEIKPEINLRDSEAISSRKMNQMSKFYIDLDGEVRQKGDNLWGLFSGVTKYTTHSTMKSDSTETKMFDGVIGRKDRQIFKQLVELV